MTAMIIALLPLFIIQEIAPADTTDDGGSLNTYEHLLAGDTLDYQERFDLARNLAHTNHWKEAIEVYSFLLADHPQDTDVLLGRGLVYAWDGRYAEAEADLLQVTEKAPTYTDAWMALGNVYLWWDYPERAVPAYSVWVDLEPALPEPYFSRAKAYLASRDFARARRDLDEARRQGGDPEMIARLSRDLDRIPGARPLETMILLGHDTFSDDRPDWNNATFSVKRELSTGSFSLGLLRARRFDKTDKGLLLDSYLNLWRRAYGNFRLQLVPERKVLPSSDATLEVFQGFGRGWEISGLYRMMVYPMTIVQLYGTTLARYSGQWYIRSVVHYVPKDAGADLFAMAIARRYLETVDDFLEIGSGFGAGVETGVDGPLHTTSEVYTVRAQRFLNQRLGITFNATFQRTVSYKRWSLMAGLITHW